MERTLGLVRWDSYGKNVYIHVKGCFVHGLIRCFLSFLNDFVFCSVSCRFGEKFVRLDSVLLVFRLMFVFFGAGLLWKQTCFQTIASGFNALPIHEKKNHVLIHSLRCKKSPGQSVLFM
jgi:hypothetical protein